MAAHRNNVSSCPLCDAARISASVGVNDKKLYNKIGMYIKHKIRHHLALQPSSDASVRSHSMRGDLNPKLDIPSRALYESWFKGFSNRE
jgi:hypothetical protein